LVKPEAAATAGPVAPALPLLPEILLESLVALADAGEIERACRLAGRACSALRKSDPRTARRFDVFLHRTTPGLAW
jgi:hypothetical protein